MKANSGSFQKGNVSWSKGLKMSNNFCQKISTSCKGRKAPNKKPDTLCIICGKKLSRHAYTKCRECYTKEMSIKMSLLMSGRIVSEETKQKMRVPHPWNQGEKHRSWKGGITPINEKIRKTREYMEWRHAVFVRDNYTCQECQKHGGNLHADHIKPFFLYPELRFDINNGRTLCIPCHRKTPTYGNKPIYTQVI